MAHALLGSFRPKWVSLEEGGPCLVWAGAFAWGRDPRLLLALEQWRHSIGSSRPAPQILAGVVKEYLELFQRVDEPKGTAIGIEKQSQDEHDRP